MSRWLLFAVCTIVCLWDLTARCRWSLRAAWAVTWASQRAQWRLWEVR